MSRFIEVDGKQYRLEPDGELYANHGDTSRLVCTLSVTGPDAARIVWHQPTPAERAAITVGLVRANLTRPEPD